MTRPRKKKQITVPGDTKEMVLRARASRLGLVFVREPNAKFGWVTYNPSGERHAFRTAEVLAGHLTAIERAVNFEKITSLLRDLGFTQQERTAILKTIGTVLSHRDR